MKLGFIKTLALVMFWSWFCVEAATFPSDIAALRAFRSQIGDNNGRLRSWWGNDPCGNGTNWEGVFCTPDANGIFHVTELRLLNRQLSGTLAPELGNLRSLRILDVMWNNITGSIPATFGMLESLELLLLNGNGLTGVLPWELGNLTNMNRIQIDENRISGPVPPTFGNLTSVKHFHMNNNSLNGSIPPDLGRLPGIVHILFDNNELTGTLPAELANLKTLLILQLDNNRFDDDAVIPAEYGGITTLFKLSMRNCNLQGQVPDLSNISQLGYLDLSNNRLSGSIPDTRISRNITSIDLSTNNLTGEIPQSFHNLPMLQALLLSNNNLGGSVDGSLIDGTNSSQKLLIDLQQNNFTSVDQTLINNVTSSSGRFRAWLAGNPVCENSAGTRVAPVCQSGTLTSQTAADQGSGNNRTTCNPTVCTLDQLLIPALSVIGECYCAYPTTIGYRLKSPGFTFFDRFVNRFEGYISSGLNLTMPQIFLRNFQWETGPRLRLTIDIFPDAPVNRNLSIPELRRIYRAFGGWMIPDDDVFGPYEFISFTPPTGVTLYDIIGPPSKKKLSGGAIAGILIGVIAATAVVVGIAVFYISRKKEKRRSESRKKILVDKRQFNEMLKVTGVKSFTYQEMMDATESLSESRFVGRGGYGQVYRGVLADGMIVAVKRAEEGSLQGTREFYTEIELLSRVHHRNLLSLIGYCDDEDEQMLVYEFMEGGTLRERLSPNMKLPLDFATRLRIALGAARGILYLHTEANPPIFHRDIKASNILLDPRNTPKVADFGLSKLAPLPDIDGTAPSGHVSTVVKGTPGYLDPEYFLTRKLTDKSDVYSFGVVLMELVTGMHPISQGKNLVREVVATYQSGKVLSIVDQSMGAYPSEGLEPLLRLSLKCVKEDPDERPSMAEVVRDLEDICRSMPWSDALSTAEHETKPKRGIDEEPLRSDIYNEMYPSSNMVEESGLFSGTVQAVAPR